MPLPSIDMLSDDEQQPPPVIPAATPKPKATAAKNKAKAKAKKTETETAGKQSELDSKKDNSEKKEKKQKGTKEPNAKPKPKAKAALKRPAASSGKAASHGADADPEPPMKKPAGKEQPAERLSVCKSLYKRDGVWSIKLNSKEVIRVIGLHLGTKRSSQFISLLTCSYSFFAFCSKHI